MEPKSILHKRIKLYLKSLLLILNGDPVVWSNFTNGNKGIGSHYRIKDNIISSIEHFVNELVSDAKLAQRNFASSPIESLYQQLEYFKRTVELFGYQGEIRLDPIFQTHDNPFLSCVLEIITTGITRSDVKTFLSLSVRCFCECFIKTIYNYNESNSVNNAQFSFYVSTLNTLCESKKLKLITLL